MAGESTLSISKDELSQSIGVFCGYGRGTLGDEIAWTTRQQNRIDDCLKSGVRNFYWPKSPDGSPQHSWTFLRPVTSLTLAAGESQVDLPDDYGGTDESLTFSGSAGTALRLSLTLSPDAYIRQAYSLAGSGTPTKGTPRMVSQISLKGISIPIGQRFALHFYPVADVDYAFEIRYSILADALSSTKPWVYGGAAHTETIIESCLAGAEQRVFDTKGVHSANYLELLKVSIDLDKRFQPISLGYNADYSDFRDRQFGPGVRHTHDGSLITRSLT